MSEKRPDFAGVVKVAEVTGTIKTPGKACEGVVVTRQVPVKDEPKILGAVARALIAGVLGQPGRRRLGPGTRLHGRCGCRRLRGQLRSGRSAGRLHLHYD